MKVGIRYNWLHSDTFGAYSSERWLVVSELEETWSNPEHVKENLKRIHYMKCFLDFHEKISRASLWYRRWREQFGPRFNPVPPEYPHFLRTNFGSGDVCEILLIDGEGVERWCYNDLFGMFETAEDFYVLPKSTDGYIHLSGDGFDKRSRKLLELENFYQGLVDPYDERFFVP